MRKSLVSALIATTLFTSTATAQQSKPLSRAQVAQQVTGQSFRYSGHINGQYYSGTIQFQSNKNLRVATDSQAPEGGTWRIKGKSICTRLTELRAGNETCYTLRKLSADQFQTSHGFVMKRQ